MRKSRNHTDFLWIRPSTWLSFLTLLLTLYVMALVQVGVDVRADFDAEPLPDLLHDAWYVTWSWAPTVTIAVMSGITLLMVLLLTARPQLVIRRMAWILSVLFAMRALTIPITQFPNPYLLCERADATLLARPFLAAWHILTGQLMTCADVMFSAHTSLLVTMAWAWLLYTHHWAARLFGVLCALFGALIIVVTRLHYTADVLVAILLTSLVHMVYFFAVALGEVIKPRGAHQPVFHSWFPGAWLIQLIRHMDDNNRPEDKHVHIENGRGHMPGAYHFADIKIFLQGGAAGPALFMDRVDDGEADGIVYIFDNLSQ